MMKAKLSKHLVAFIDILGASDRMKNDGEKFLIEIKNLIDHTKSYVSIRNAYNRKVHGETKYKDLENFTYKELEPYTYSELKEININLFNINTFSDNILISIKCNEQKFSKGLHDICSFLQIIIINALKQGLLLRGGLTYDDFYRESDFIYGTALVRAYETESRHAIYPRIVVDADIVRKYQESHDDKLNIKQDNDGIWSIDNFSTSVYLAKAYLQDQEKFDAFKREYDDLIIVKENLTQQLIDVSKKIFYDEVNKKNNDDYRPFENINWIISDYNNSWLNPGNDPDKYKNQMINTDSY